MTVMAPPGGSCPCLVDALTAAWAGDGRVAVVALGRDPGGASEAMAATQEATAAIAGAPDGRVVVVAPVPSPAPDPVVRGSAVAGLVGGQVRDLALLAAPQGTVNGVLHGPIADAAGCGPGCVAGGPDERSAAAAAAIARRLVTMAEVLASVAFVASAEAGYLTGTVLTVDGGLNVGRHA